MNISHNYIKWSQANEVQYQVEKLEQLKGILGVIGAIDDTKLFHTYFKCKKYYSLHHQAIVNADMKLIDIHFGEPGMA